jgi:hypothetical protein
MREAFGTIPQHTTMMSPAIRSPLASSIPRPSGPAYVSAARTPVRSAMPSASIRVCSAVPADNSSCCSMSVGAKCTTVVATQSALRPLATSRPSRPPPSTNCPACALCRRANAGAIFQCPKHVDVRCIQTGDGRDERPRLPVAITSASNIVEIQTDRLSDAHSCDRKQPYQMSFAMFRNDIIKSLNKVSSGRTKISSGKRN